MIKVNSFLFVRVLNTSGLSFVVGSLKDNKGRRPSKSIVRELLVDDEYWDSDSVVEAPERDDYRYPVAKTRTNLKYEDILDKVDAMERVAKYTRAALERTIRPVRNVSDRASETTHFSKLFYVITFSALTLVAILTIGHFYSWKSIFGSLQVWAPTSAVHVSSSSSSTAATKPTNVFAQSLAQLGANNCVARANQLPDVISKSTEAVVLQKPSGDVDQSLITAMLLPKAASNVKGVSVMSLAPNQSNGCGASYQSIDVIEKPCATAVPEIFGPNKATPIGSSGFAMVPLGQLARVLVIPTATTCVLVKQEYVP